VIQLLWSQRVKTGEIYERMTIHLGGNCVSQRFTIQRKYSKQNGRVFWWPSSETCVEVKEQKYRSVWDNRRSARSAL